MCYRKLKIPATEACVEWFYYHVLNIYYGQIHWTFDYPCKFHHNDTAPPKKTNERGNSRKNHGMGSEEGSLVSFEF
jgi:hypothetical protein